MRCQYHKHDGPGQCPICQQNLRDFVGSPEGDELKPGRMHTDNESSALIRAMYEASVMKAPTEEQLKDPKWWDENAPEGAQKYSPSTQYFYKEDDGYWFVAKSGEPWVDLFLTNHLAKEGVSRPTTPPAPEWDGEGLPPVGCECEMSLGFHCGIQAKITYVGDGVFCYRNLRNGAEYTGAISDATFRPLRTKEQLEREELAEVLTNFFFDDVSESLKPEDIADAIIAAGWRKAGDE